ncbi:hypothetical protein CROQUDRAFT_42250 [Cronartium quercuum f. sp. fusiforme G11]|uniref:Dopey N-terminal domain-containing protein n=1 Tax=Cronartium quercuum f. sp. fusiforme G11 TaxID=708437 RepID=A0A9P6NPF6_9BASI|nr:hypothetical protein CROQUDRAFT_42250 [Cronartium quercuum f. sp. fusiforme G11]
MSSGPPALPSSSSSLPKLTARSPALHQVPSIASLRSSSQSHPHATLSSASVDKTSAFAEQGEVKSGRALSVGRRARDDWIAGGQEKALIVDPKFRKYASLVERTLLSIDQVNEWADFITFLAKLLKTLQSHPQYPIIPHKLTVAKRLSQCLNPALPQGVHQRALDVYEYILTTIGPDGLRRDLQVWSAGLFPFFQYAATAVRPIVLSLYEKHYLPLKADLRPAIKAFVLALLPGLEEETGEHFDRVCALLDQLSGAVSLSFFLQNMWLVLISGPGYRISALNFLSRRMPKFEPDQSIAPVVGEDVGLMVRGYSAALEDSNILVQRGILDLILNHLRLDSFGFINDTRPTDQLLLARAALGVVLRRDLSLSRRLYTWLLGPSPTTEEPTGQQLNYFRKFGLNLVTKSLREDMQAKYVDLVVERQRPFKIFIALLDKWEIGGPVTEALALDSFRALKGILKPDDTQDELLLTANMLFDALDLYTTWKTLFNSAYEYAVLDQSPSDCLSLIKFITQTFRMNDEELLRIHVPIMAFALIDIVDVSKLKESKVRLSQLEALQVTAALLQEIPVRFYEIASETEELQRSTAEMSNLRLAQKFYEADNFKEVDPICMHDLKDPKLYFTGLSAVLRIVAHIAAIAPSKNQSEMLDASLDTLETLLKSVRAAHVRVSLDWNPQAWATPVLECLQTLSIDAGGFTSTEKLVRVMLALSDGTIVSPAFPVDSRNVLSVIIGKLLDFLQRQAAPFFLQTVKLIWDLNKLSKYRHIEGIITARLCSRDAFTRELAFEAFGNLWRYTDDALLPGACLKIPMLIVLDSLKDENLVNRRCGEAWMRCSLKSYLRVLDPLFITLIASDIQRSPTTITLGDRTFSIYHYVHPFDQACVHHALECILTLARFGGHGFTRIAKTCYMKHAHDPALRKLIDAADLSAATYLDGLVKVLIMYIDSDPAPLLIPAMGTYNLTIHATAADVVQMIVSRGDLTTIELGLIEGALSNRLLISIRSSEYNLQNKFLHALHATISAGSTASPQSVRPISLDLDGRKDKSEPDLATQLFTTVVGDGITAQRNSAVIHHWIDFLLMTIPQYRRSLDDVVNPLIDRLVERIRTLVNDLETTYHANAKGKSIASESTDSEYAVFVNALERLLVVLIEGGGVTAGLGDGFGGKGSTERLPAPESSSSLFAGVFNVLGASESTIHLPHERPKTDFQVRLGTATSVLMKSWDIGLRVSDSDEAESSSSKAYFASRIKIRTRKAFERLYKAVANEILEAIIDYWNSEVASFLSVSSTEDHLFMLLDHLAPSAQTVVNMLYERLSAFGHLAQTDRGKAVASTSFLSEGVLFAFLEAYLSRLEGPIAVQIWSTSLNFARDVLANPTTTKGQMFPTLKCFSILADKISQTSALEDRRMRRDLQDTFVKLCDNSVQGAGKSLEQIKSKLDSNGDPPTSSIEKEFSTSATPASTFNEDRKGGDIEKPATGSEITVFMTEKALPGCRRFLLEHDKLNSICVGIMYYIVTPAFKSRTRISEVDDTIHDLLIEMTKHSAATKAWRAHVTETFNDPKFFSCSPEAGRRWRPIIQALLNTDKERFTEMLSRLTTAPSANIFTNKESEMVTRSINLRRITYAVYAAEYNRFLVHLPSIQEKVVDLLRSNVGEIVHAEVYLCMRVLLCRIANQHLGGFWPIILTELTRLFESMIENVPDTPHFLALALSASKFLDLLLVLQTGDFQIHQWMFITDTVDAMYPPDPWFPHAIIDRLAGTLSERSSAPGDRPRSSLTIPSSVSPPVFRLIAPKLSRQASASSLPTRFSGFIDQDYSSSPAVVMGRRPLLSRTKKIENVGPLERFFSKISLTNYEACYAGGVVDWDEVELDLEVDLFDGN